MNRRPLAQLALLLVLMLHAACDEEDPIGASYSNLCEPECNDRKCGADGCGGSCGECGCGETCEEGLCEFTVCDGRECGDDGCGGSCGECDCGESCIFGACEFTACDGRECDGDGCGGSCGQCTQWPLSACINGLCTCSPSCIGKVCADGCGGVCPPGCGVDEFCNHLFDMCDDFSLGKPCPNGPMEDCGSDADACLHNEADGWSLCTVLCSSDSECPELLGPGSCCGEVKSGDYYCLPSYSATCSQ